MPGQSVSALQDMLAGMSPVLHADPWQFVLVEGDASAALPPDAFAIIREAEGVTAIVPCKVGGSQPFARITLQVHSALEGVGLTAAVSGALADARIACNVIAGYHHDHLFVPWDRRLEAIALLEKLSTHARH